MVLLQPYERPQVLLLGNGLNRSFGGVSWSELLDKISVRDDMNVKDLKAPFPLQAVLVTNNKFKPAMKKIRDFCSKEVAPELAEQLQQLLAIGFDDILTTNYGYELEAVAAGKPQVTKSYLQRTNANIKDGEKAEPKYLLSTYHGTAYHEIPQRIWHIHGEARKPDSMILGHYYYAGLLTKMRQFSVNRGGRYFAKQQKREVLTMKGWIDSFILGDVYILGLGMDFSELDLWWLLARKADEKAEHGKVYFYTIQEEKHFERDRLLEALGAEVRCCGCEITEETADKDQAYKEFYYKAIADIKKLTAQNRCIKSLEK